VKIACVVRRGAAGKGPAPAGTSPAAYPAGTGDRIRNYREVCEMQDAETVLGILRERGRKGLPCEELYRQMFNPHLYLLATGGSTPTTAR
jgi:hypothetical protein